MTGAPDETQRSGFDGEKEERERDDDAGHEENEYNNRCDALAVKEREKLA